MKQSEKDTLLLAMRFDPDRVIELLEVRWDELRIDFNLIFKQNERLSHKL